MTRSLYAPLAFIENQWQEHVVIGIDDAGVITQIHSGDNRSNAEQTQLEHCRGALIPGIPNCHSHAFQFIFAGLTEGQAITKGQTTTKGGARTNNQKTDNFWSWREQMYRFAHQLTPDHQYIIAQYLYIQMLKAGYTSVGEFHYLHHQTDGTHYDDIAETSLSVLAAAQCTGIRLTHLPVYYGQAGFFGQAVESMQRPFYNSIDNYLLIQEGLQKHIKDNTQITLGMAIHSLRAASQADIQDLVTTMNKNLPNGVIHIHIAEQQKEVEDCLQVYAKRPVQWLLDNLTVDKHWSLIHGTHINEKERSAIIKSGASVGLCPTTEANLGDGFFPIDEYLKAGGTFSIGTDSQVTIDPFEEMKWLEYSQRLVQQKRVLLTENNDSVGQTLYRRCAEGGSQSLGIDSGVIEVGKKADFIVLDTDHVSVSERGVQNLLDIAVFVAGKNLVKDVIVGGQWVVRDRHHRLEEKAESDFRRVTSLCLG